RGAVQLKALTDGQIERYLNQVRPGMWAAIQESPQMQKLLKQLLGEELQEEVGLLRSPLFVSIAAIVYQPEQPFRSKADLLEKYIDRQLALGKDRKGFKNRKWAYKNPKREPDWRDTRHYLKWLATKLKQNNQTELLIERLQPSWLDTPAQRRSYALAVGLIFGLVLAQILGLISGLQSGLAFGLPAGLVIGMAKIEPKEAFKISMPHEVRLLIFKLILRQLKNWLVFGLCFLTPCFMLSFGLVGGLTMGLATVLILGLCLLFQCVLVVGLQQELKNLSKPNQGIWNSFSFALFSVVLSSPLGFVSALTPHLVKAFTEGKSVETLMLGSIKPISSALVFGIFWGLLFSLFLCGGLAFIQHFCLRFILACNHSAPWDYVSFLNYCCERRLLQPVGGRYRFLHKELLEHFAQDGEVG
ncbi:MAG TPA: hypothetical protein V6D18_20135, partial [Thermosynechococcaceae cyanobacterium]